VPLAILPSNPLAQEVFRGDRPALFFFFSLGFEFPDLQVFFRSSFVFVGFSFLVHLVVAGLFEKNYAFPLFSLLCPVPFNQRGPSLSVCCEKSEEVSPPFDLPVLLKTTIPSLVCSGEVPFSLKTILLLIAVGKSIPLLF